VVTVEYMTISHPGRCLAYPEAVRIARSIPPGCPAGIVLIDLERTIEATTAGLARLILLRRQLLAAGADLRIRGLRSRAQALYEICRMTRLLPRL
jgi:ABC-type transporter Mla MlaB component